MRLKIEPNITTHQVMSFLIKLNSHQNQIHDFYVLQRNSCFQYNKRIFYICRRLAAQPGEFLAPFIRVNPPNINLACSVYLKAKQLQSGSLRALFVVKKNPLCDHYTTFIKDGRGQDTTPVGFFVYFRWDRDVLTATFDSHMWRKKSKRIRCRVFVNNNK